MTLTEAHRELHKWLNEEQLKPIDREALATVLAAIAQEPTSAEYAQGYAAGFNDACRPVQPAISIDALVAEFEATPKGLAAMQEGRQWVRETLAQPKREWVGLTDEEQQQAYEQWQNEGWGVFYRAIEAKLKEKNT